MGTESGPVIGWLLEHVNFNLGIPTHLLSLPSNLKLKSLDDSTIIYIHQNDEPDLAFLAIFCPSDEETNELLGHLKQCSLTFFKSSVGKRLFNVQPAVLALREKAEITTNMAINRLESLKYEHDFIKRQQEALKLDNTLLATQSSVNTQLYSESIELHVQENSHLKNELEMALNEISLRDETISKLKRELANFKQTVSETQESVEELRNQLNSANTAFDESNMIPDRKLRVLYTKKAKQVNLLSLELLSAKFDNSKLVARYHSLKGEMKNELDKIHDMVESDYVYSLLKLWIMCNELKVEYYENLPDLKFDERNKLLEKIEKTQIQLNVAMTIARAMYISYRTQIFDQVLNSFVDNRFGTFKASHNIMNSAFEKISWVFQPETGDAEPSGPVWINNVKMTRLVENTLYNNSGNVWYNRVSFASALRPVVTYDQDDKSDLEIKKRLYCLLDQNNQLRQKLRSLSKQIGSDYHWKSIWKRTQLKRKPTATK
ncbi:hypothetical protein MACJ_002951 [Theileria orientalis]|uniref:Uncharacterized protein n=1 Tax=Theileria orientalis TaxID=68886 RepID=A0A976QQV6_THEOR|nr:hypothetical protein MACJ_002951 [Theileria orientalis]